MSKQVREALEDCVAFITGQVLGPAQRDGIVKEAIAALRSSAESAPVTDGSLKPGDRLSYVLDEGTKIGRITAHTRPIEPAPDIQKVKKT